MADPSQMSDDELLSAIGGNQGTATATPPSNNNQSTNDPSKMSDDQLLGAIGGTQSSSSNDTTQSPTSSQPQIRGDLQDQVMANIAQFGKNAYSVTPFAKRIAQLTNSNADQVYASVGQPNGILQNISAMAGQMAPQIALAAPFMKAANVLLAGGKIAGAEVAGAQNIIKSAMPNITGKIIGSTVGSPMARGALGLGTYSGTRTALTGGNGQQITDATTQGMQQGLLYGFLSKVGATVIPKQLLGEKFASTAGSAMGGAIAGAMTSSGGDNTKANALFMGALSALAPEERIDFHKFIANNVSQPQFSKYMREGLQISPEDTKTILDNGMNEVQRVGEMTVPQKNPITGNTDTLGPVQIAQQFYHAAQQGIKKLIGKQFEDALATNVDKNPKDINDFVSGLKEEVDKYGDPTSPIVRRFNTTYNALQGFNPTTTETEIPGTKEQPNVAANPRKTTISDLPPHLQTQVRAQLGQTGDITNLDLNNLHELKMNLSDAISDRAWKTGEFDPNERFAFSLQKKIGDYIGENNDAYRTASKEYSRMRSVSDDINSLNTNNLGKDWAEMAPENKIDMMNKLNGIGSYLKEKGFGEYNPKGLLDKYHAYNAMANPDPTSFRNNAPMKIAFQRGAALLGGAVGLPFGLHGAAIGAAIGNLVAIQYMRPKSYIPILKEMKPNLKVPEDMNSQQALDLLDKLVSSKK